LGAAYLGVLGSALATFPGLCRFISGNDILGLDVEDVFVPHLMLRTSGWRDACGHLAGVMPADIWPA
jgi:hypothetical protein